MITCTTKPIQHALSSSTKTSPQLAVEKMGMHLKITTREGYPWEKLGLYMALNLLTSNLTSNTNTLKLK